MDDVHGAETTNGAPDAYDLAEIVVTASRLAESAFRTPCGSCPASWCKRQGTDKGRRIFAALQRCERSSTLTVFDFLQSRSAILVIAYRRFLFCCASGHVFDFDLHFLAKLIDIIRVDLLTPYQTAVFGA